MVAQSINELINQLLNSLNNYFILGWGGVVRDFGDPEAHRDTPEDTFGDHESGIPGFMIVNIVCC
jgi:hypothetical protein